MIWEDLLEQFECSKCKNIFMVPDYGGGDWLNKPDYCPFCGEEFVEAEIVQ